MFNMWVGSGRLTKEIELQFTASGKALAKGSIAVNRKLPNGNEKTLFLDFTAWEKQAEILVNHTTKASRLLLKGRLEQDTWEKDGKKHSKILLVVEDFQFLDKKEV